MPRTQLSPEELERKALEGRAYRSPKQRAADAKMRKQPGVRGYQNVPKGKGMRALEMILGKEFSGPNVAAPAKTPVKEAWGLKGGMPKGAWGKMGLAARPLSGLLALLFAGKDIHDIFELRGRRKQLEATQDIPQVGVEDHLRSIRDRYRLAASEGRLMRQDPEAYAALQGVLSGQGQQPKLATGEFMVGGPAPRNVSREDMQGALGALM